MRRLAFSPRWLLGLLICVLAASVCGFLGRWQWDVAQARRGTLQNTAYAFNWWLFAVLFLGFWLKALRDRARMTSVEVPRMPSPGPRRDPAPQPTWTPPVAEEDPEVTQWNSWLRDMNDAH